MIADDYSGMRARLEKIEADRRAQVAGAQALPETRCGPRYSISSVPVLSQLDDAKIAEITRKFREAFARNSNRGRVIYEVSVLDGSVTKVEVKSDPKELLARWREAWYRGDSTEGILG